MIEFLKKYKKEIAIFLFAISFYFTLGLLFSYNFGLYKYWNGVFDLDSPRVFWDLTDFSANHYRSTVHPLFVLFFQPMCRLIGHFFKDMCLSSLLIQSIFASISLISVHVIFNKMKIKNVTNILLTVLFGLSFGQIVFSSNIETYIFAQGFLSLMWLFASIKIDKELKFIDYILLVIFGVCSLAVTLTNVVQYIIVLFFVVTMNKKVKNSFTKTVFIGIYALSLSVLLACIQNIIWTSAPNFFTKNILDFMYGTSEENLYIDKGFSLHKIMFIINALFSYSFGICKLFIPKVGVYLTFESSKIGDLFSIFCFILFIVLNVATIIKTKCNIVKNKFYYALLATFIFNFCFHFFYGNSITFLYICHFNFIFILLLGKCIEILNIKLFENKIICCLGIILMILLSLRLIIIMFIKLSPVFNAIEYFRLLPFLIIIVLLIISILFMFEKKWHKIISILLVILAVGGVYLFINRDQNTGDCDEFCSYKHEFVAYEKQLKELRNSFMIESYSDRDEPIGVMFFGMADRRKMVYKAGKIYDAYTEELIKEFDYDEELIIPNIYTVVLKDGDNLYKIVEDEDGVYVYINGVKEELTTGKHINFLSYDGYKYSEVLKVLFQEVLFNIDGSEPKPNIWAYKQAFYRDAMMITMVLENTSNTDLILEWVNGLTNIYDNSRAVDIDETDNLGDLLYIIGATNSDNEALVNKILKEINRLKDKDNHISGMVDGSIMTYYPTSLAIYGGEKLGIDVGLEYPVIDDNYGKLTWYNDHRVESYLLQNDIYYPYLNWAYYHYSGYGKLFVLDEIYPLTYEGGQDYQDSDVVNECFISEFYCRKDIFISHSWTASEMYLYLIEK